MTAASVREAPGFIFPQWPAPAAVRAAFTLRTGGVSSAPYDALNIGARIGDSPDALAENRRRVRAALQLPAEPVWLEQVHGIEVVDLDRLAEATDLAAAQAAADSVAPAMASVPIGDAVISKHPGRVCAIRVADCMPVLFSSLDGSAVGAAHAGWRGLAGGVLEATVDRLALPPSQLIAWMGPSIGPAHFEVGDDVYDAFAKLDGGAVSAFTRNPRGRWQCDLYVLARRRLEAIGVTSVHGGGWCTFADRQQFFSYRRDGQCGRMAALIWIQP